ncbi:MAG: hypothetical protein IJJ99_05405 [Oscillospiraceae bacterium]|nr:hypothetical protein [Oscillospiraceae bacterium]
MKFGSFIGGLVVGALVASSIPYEIKRDEENGIVEMRSLLWAWKKTPGEDKDNYAFAIPPSGLDVQPEEKAESVAEEIAEELAEAVAEAVEEPAEPAADATEAPDEPTAE